LDVINNKRPERPTLFEFFLNSRLYEGLTGQKMAHDGSPGDTAIVVKAFAEAGYDHVTLHASRFGFPTNKKTSQKSHSLNDSSTIYDWESYERYEWQDPNACGYDLLDAAEAALPEGMGIIVYSPGGVLENAINLAGFDNLCYMIFDEPKLAERIFSEVGERLCEYYRRSVPHKAVFAAIVNDDWGFNTQTMLTTEQMRRYVIPWHKRIVEVIHKTGKPAVLHSCGNLANVMEDIIEVIGFQAKHSFEDVIMPIERHYELYKDRIAHLGGIDVDFVCRAPLDEVKDRSRAMLKAGMAGGGYALGTGNSVPHYVPDEGYFAMTSVAFE